MKDKIVLALAPHTDDVELGCGGALHRWTQEGAEVHYVAFSKCEKSLPDGLHPNTLEFEARKAAPCLGIAEGHISILDFEVREFPSKRQEILEKMVQLRAKIKPDVILMPSTQDIHQDHKTITEEAIRAFKNGSLLGYELPWNNFNFPTNGHVVFQQENLDAKVKALAEYRSQGFRQYMQGDFVTSLALVRGGQIGQKFAEAFEIIRWVI